MAVEPEIRVGSYILNKNVLEKASADDPVFRNCDNAAVSAFLRFDDFASLSFILIYFDKVVQR